MPSLQGAAVSFFSGMQSLLFLLVLLPTCLFVYHILPEILREYALLVFSIAFYFLVYPVGLIPLFIILILDYLAGLVFAKGKNRLSSTLIKLCIAKSILLLLFVLAFSTVVKTTVLLGVFIYSLSSIYYLLDLLGEVIPPEKNLPHLALYYSYFPRLYAGPVYSYKYFTNAVENIKLTPKQSGMGFGQYIQGAVKSTVFAEGLYLLYKAIRQLPASQVSVLSSWCVVISLAFGVYYYISGLCDMAQGVSLLFGITLPKNFYYPYQSRNISDFFERFNITINSFIKQKVYTPMGGDSHGIILTMLNTIIFGMLAGLCFGFSVNYLVWGIYLGVFLLLERYVYPKLLENIPVIVSRIYSLAIVLISFTIFAGSSLSQSVGYAKNMLGLGDIPFYNDQIMYYLSSNWLLLLLSVVLATNIFSICFDTLRKASPLLSAILLGVVNVALVVVFVSFAV